MAEADPEIPTPEAAASEPKGSEAAAILLMLLGDEEAADILSRLDPHDVQHLGSAMFGVADVSEGQVESVFDLFLNKAKARTTIGFGATPRIRAVMQHALGAERAESMLAASREKRNAWLAELAGHLDDDEWERLRAAAPVLEKLAHS